MLHQTPAIPAISPPPKGRRPRSNTPDPHLTEIVAAAIAAEGDASDEVLGSRKRQTARSRQAAMWLAFKVTTHSLTTIGRSVGRHHTTVLYGIKAHERRIQKDPRTRALSERLLTRFLEDADDGARS